MVFRHLNFTLSTVVNACACIPPMILEGKQINARIVRTGFLENKNMQTSLLNMYAKCGFVRDARDVFDRMADKDVIGLDGHHFWVREVQQCYRGPESFLMRCQSWTRLDWAAMVACYDQNGYVKEAIDIYEKMREETVTINEGAMMGAISACTQT
ncbi:Pentatricopeptide repeat [Parasponia andersonii]|uniref:Pentatricopeptide repeat n=1 Tax=Parasponia andersonii TaxID=3476 RepID=A0A2P5BE36_PARAD|nr:Pentatricopeptide repeat [Parasponia andersonii]